MMDTCMVKKAVEMEEPHNELLKTSENRKKCN
jgi:hypothetical protein